MSEEFEDKAVINICLTRKQLVHFLAWQVLGANASEETKRIGSEVYMRLLKTAYQ